MIIEEEGRRKKEERKEEGVKGVQPAAKREGGKERREVGLRVNICPILFLIALNFKFKREREREFSLCPLI